MLLLPRTLEKQTLPDGIAIYDVQGQTIFPLYTNDGGLARAAVFYIHKDNKFLGVKINSYKTGPDYIDYLQRALAFAISRFQSDAKETKLNGELPTTLEFIDAGEDV